MVAGAARWWRNAALPALQWAYNIRQLWEVQMQSEDAQSNTIAVPDKSVIVQGPHAE